MAKEDRSQRHSNTSSGGSGGGGGSSGAYDHHRYSKKLRQKKIPQRGLGVAQLEKIRLEEQQQQQQQQQKKDVSSSNSPLTDSIISPSNSSNCLGFRTTMSPPLIPSPPPPHCPNNLPLILMNSGGGENGWLMGGLDHRDGFAFMKNVRLPYESTIPTWPLPSVVQQKSQQFQQACSSSIVNVSTGTSSPLSESLLNFQMEPPSNQSFCGINNVTPPLWPEQEKMVGMKRSYPFALDHMPIPEFQFKLPSSVVSPISRSDKSASCSNGVTTTIEPSNPHIGEELSNSSAISEPSPKKVAGENGGGLGGDFLKLAPPERDSSTKQEQQLSTKLRLQQFEEVSQYVEKQHTLINFIPPAETNTGQIITRRKSDGNRAGECVDLNLKL